MGNWKEPNPLEVHCRGTLPSTNIATERGSPQKEIRLPGNYLPTGAMLVGGRVP